MQTEQAEAAVRASTPGMTVGDRRTLSVLFGDIRGITNLFESVPPEQAVTLLNTYLATATEAISAHGGTVDKYLADAVMALFGAPVELEDHALQAVRAALEIQRRFRDLPHQTDRRPALGMVINTGEGVLGSIGAGEMMSPTVLGDVVNVAARLQGEARAGEVLVTAATYQQIADRVDAEETGHVYVKGRPAPITMYRVIGIRDL
jgi:class 3 adenylate cyclase